VFNVSACNRGMMDNASPGRMAVPPCSEVRRIPPGKAVFACR
jgi:hypothetical protein